MTLRSKGGPWRIRQSAFRDSSLFVLGASAMLSISNIRFEAIRYNQTTNVFLATVDATQQAGSLVLADDVCTEAFTEALHNVI